MNIAGADTKNIDGVNLLPYLTGENRGTPHDTLYWRFGDQMAIRFGDYKLVRYDENADTLVGKQLPAIGPFLYNLATDIGETKDLSRQMPDKLRELQTKWDAWNKTLESIMGFRQRRQRRRPKTTESQRKRKKTFRAFKFEAGEADDLTAGSK